MVALMWICVLCYIKIVSQSLDSDSRKSGNEHSQLDQILSRGRGEGVAFVSQFADNQFGRLIAVTAVPGVLETSFA